MIFDPNWVRWIKASFAKHFDTNKDDTFLHVEGFERATEGKSDWLELRMDGPYLKEHTKGEWLLETEFNILICVMMNASNAYRMETLTGRVAGICEKCIPVYKYGDTDADDQSLLGYCTLQPREKEKVIVSNFGQVRPDTKLLQSSVEAHYKMHLDW